jgi:hypothetical protein
MKPPRINIRLGNCLDVMRELPDATVDSVCTDPPYGLRFMGRKWDYDVPGVHLWEEMLRVMKPGAHLVAFAGSRTYHRMAVNIEDAGFEIRDQILWVYGSGFPKSLDVSKAIDKDVVSAISPTAAKWEGWGTALKPAHEPAVLARKPLEGTVADNVCAHGTGAINVDGCRVPADQRHKDKCALVVGARSNRNGQCFGEWPGQREDSYSPLGRWPANLLHDGSPEALAIFPATGPGKSGGVAGWQKGGYVGGQYEPIDRTGYDDAGGSAARFFYCAKASRAERDAGLAHLEPMAGHEAVDRKEGSAGVDNPRAGAGRTANQVRNAHPTVKPVALMRYLVRLITPPGGHVLDPFAGSGTTAVACIHEGFTATVVEMGREWLPVIEGRVAHASRAVRERLL